MIGLWLAGCSAQPWRSLSIAERFQHPDPAARLSAVVDAGHDRRRDLAPFLVDRLTDSEPEVRLAAILALEKITGKTLGYQYWAPAPSREKAAERWRQWLVGPDQARTPAGTGDAVPSPSAGPPPNGKAAGGRDKEPRP